MKVLPCWMTLCTCAEAERPNPRSTAASIGAMRRAARGCERSLMFSPPRVCDDCCAVCGPRDFVHVFSGHTGACGAGRCGATPPAFEPSEKCRLSCRVWCWLLVGPLKGRCAVRGWGSARATLRHRSGRSGHRHAHGTGTCPGRRRCARRCAFASGFGADGTSEPFASRPSLGPHRAE